jgi:hypothetical protein
MLRLRMLSSLEFYLCEATLILLPFYDDAWYLL